MFRFEELDIWKLALDYANDVYRLTERLPQLEKCNLIEQMRRAALSISNNIAEGSGSATNKNFSSYLDISIRSALETVSMLHFSKMRQYIKESEASGLYNKAEILIKKIRAFKNSLK